MHHGAIEDRGVICLNEAEQRIVKHIAEKRIEYNRAQRAVATIYNDDDVRNPLEAEVNYYGAEMAFCKLFNIYPDLNYVDRFCVVI